MKTILTCLVCLAGLAATANAQVLSERAARNVLLGGIAGAIIGENNDAALEGALIGAAAGAVWTAATEPGHTRVVSHSYGHRDSYGYRDPYRRHGHYSGHYGNDVVIVRPAPRVIVQERCYRPDRIVIDRDYDRRVILRDRDCDTRVIVTQKPVIIRDGGCDNKVIIVNRDHGHRVIVNGRDTVSYQGDHRRVYRNGSSAVYVQED